MVWPPLTHQDVQDAVSALQRTSGFDTFRPVGSRAFRGGGQYSDTDPAGTSRTYHVAPYACHALRVGYGNYTSTYNGNTTNNTNAVTYKLGVEVNGVIYPAIASNGQQTITVDPGGMAWFDIDLDLTAGTVFYLRPYLLPVSGTSWIANINSSSNTDGEGFIAGDSAYTGTINRSDSNLAGPVAVMGKLTAAAPSLLAIGDSITFGQGDVVGGSGRIGYFPRAVGDTVPWSNLGMSSETGAHFATQQGRFQRVPPNFTNALEAYGRNDLSSGSDFPTITAARIAIWQVLAVRGVRVRAATNLPRTTSSDGWATTTNQVVDAGGGNTVRVQLNDWIRGGAPVNPTTFAAVAVGTSGALVAGATGHPLVGFDDLADAVETSRNSGIWKVGPGNRTVTDGAASSSPGLNRTVTSATAAFTSADLGRQITLAGAGGGGGPWIGAIGKIIDSQNVSIDGNYGGTASTTVSGATLQIQDVYTYDGTHPSTIGHRALASAVTLPTA